MIFLFLYYFTPFDEQKPSKSEGEILYQYVCRALDLIRAGEEKLEQSRQLQLGELTVGENSYNPHGIVHGGALTTLADTAAGCCACSKGGHCVTSNCTMEFLRPATGKKIFCEATPKKLGRSLSTIQVTLTNDSGDVVATGTFTFFMLDV